MRVDQIYLLIFYDPRQLRAREEDLRPEFEFGIHIQADVPDIQPDKLGLKLPSARSDKAFHLLLLQRLGERYYVLPYSSDIHMRIYVKYPHPGPPLLDKIFFTAANTSSTSMPLMHL